MADDLFGASSRTLRQPDVVQPYQKPRQPVVRAWTHCPHDPPCHASVFCASGARDIRELQKKFGCSVEQAFAMFKTGKRA